MGDRHHSDACTHATPCHNRFNSSNTNSSSPHCHQKSLKQYQILPTPPSTPPRSPDSSRSTMPLRKSTHKERTASRVHFDLHMSTSHHACPNSDPSDSAATMSESGLWTVPGFDDKEIESESSNTQPYTRTGNRWSRMLQSAASSNRARHRAHLEGEGWSFVGERYGDDEEMESEESVDEEFDVVVLPRETVGC